MDNTLYNWDNQLKTLEMKISKETGISKHNKEQIKAFERYLFLERNLKPVRVVGYLHKLKIITTWLDKQECTTATKEDILDIIEHINTNGYEEWTKHGYKIAVKVFWRWLGKEALISWIKTGKPNRQKLPEELLTPEEVQSMIEEAPNPRDRALIAVLYESNTRIGEFGMIQMKHVVFETLKNTLTAVLIVDGKTGMRRIRIVQSAPDLQEWIKQHPNKEDPNAYVWINHRTHTRLSYFLFREILKTTAKAANIHKNVHPHLLRHSRSTQLATHLTESQLCYYSGWVIGSNMASVYVHLSGRDIDNAIFEMNGIS